MLRGRRPGEVMEGETGKLKESSDLLYRHFTRSSSVDGEYNRYLTPRDNFVQCSSFARGSGSHRAFPLRGTTCRASGDLVGFWVGWGQRLSGRSIVGSVRAPGALLSEGPLVDGEDERVRPGFKASACPLACGDERVCVGEA